MDHVTDLDERLVGQPSAWHGPACRTTGPRAAEATWGGVTRQRLRLASDGRSAYLGAAPAHDPVFRDEDSSANLAARGRPGGQLSATPGRRLCRLGRAAFPAARL